MRYFTEFSEFRNEFALLKNNRIGILGGTFDPVHNGHMAMARIALGEFLLGEVMFLPLGIPPHKKDQSIAPPDLRYDMLKLATEEDPRYSICMSELYREGYTYTIDTLTLLQRDNPGAEYYYIIGADTLFEIKNWRNYEKVISLINFICVLRPGLDENETRLYMDMYNEKYGCKFYLANEKGPDISSTLIRRLAADGKQLSGLLPEKVAEYIMLNGVYTKEV